MQHEGAHNLDDATLLLQLSEGDKHAFDILYNRYWKQVFNAAYKRLNDIEKAQDIAQDVFVQLWIRASASPIENLSSYLHVAARNGVFKHFEKQSRLKIVPEEAGETADPVYSDGLIMHKQFLEEFRLLVERLPAQQRTIFKMRFEDDLSSLQIAEQLQISPKTVRNQLGKALATLRSSLFMIFFVHFLR
ncbi:RNA polymerase sigma factor [Pedobacter faecalis]|uniref:RNA polymerase sigma factor n=1 Tax=Pedobacter faecalis TaxID=3041495 RepID=UPI002550DE9B|nr:sigma-70 family RNA polymerase sigma factor [Pedobacter sp. ELA7]